MNRNPLNLPPKPSDKKCNARTPKGYCKNKAGFKTGHEGEGRCHLHGGLTPLVKKNKNENDFLIQSLYTSALPTSLANELATIKTDPLFSSLINEFALLKLLVLSLVKDLPVDLANIYGKPICHACKEELDPYSDLVFIEYRKDYDNLQKRMDRTITAIREMSNVYDKISKAQERQKRYVQISDLENIIINWGKILNKHFGDDPKINIVQEELLNAGFFRQPGSQDSELLQRFREVQNNARKKYRNKHNKDGDVKVGEIYKETFEEVFGDQIQEAEVIDVDEEIKPRKKVRKKRSAHDILKQERKKNARTNS